MTRETGCGRVSRPDPRDYRSNTWVGQETNPQHESSHKVGLHDLVFLSKVFQTLEDTLVVQPKAHDELHTLGQRNPHAVVPLLWRAAAALP